MKKSNVIFNILIVLIVLSIVLYFSLKDDYQSIISAIFNMKYGFTFLAIVLFAMYRVLVGFSIHNLVMVNGEKVALWRCIQISFIILFFHGVTPFAGGGQPMEIYYLHSEKIDLTKSTNIVLQNFIVYQIALVVVGVFSLIYNYCFKLFPSDSFIKKLVIIGFMINLLILLVTYALSFGKRLNKFICNQGLTILQRLKLVKNIEATREKLNQYLTNFHTNALELKNNKRAFINNIFINILALVSLYSVPFAVAWGLGVDKFNIIESVVTTSYVMTIGSFVPIPGGTGGIEYGFVFFFGHLVSGSILNAMMLVWRFITYYLGVVIGAVCLSLYRRRDKLCE